MLPGLLAFLACTSPTSHDDVASTGADTSACAAGNIVDDAGTCVPARCGTAAAPAADVVVEEGESIQAAADSLGRGTLGLGAGTWIETLELTSDHAGLSIVGRCPELTLIDGSEGAANAGTIDIFGRGAQQFSIASLTVTGGKAWGVVGEVGNVALTDVDIAGNTGLGLGAIGTVTMTLSRVSVFGTETDAKNRTGYGMEVGNGAHVVGADVDIRDSHGAGMSLFDADIELERLSVTGTIASRDAYGYGIFADAGVTLVLSDSTLADNEHMGVHVHDGSQAAFDHISITGNGAGGISVADDGTRMSVVGGAVGGNGSADGGNGSGAQIAAGAALDMLDVSFVGNFGDGVIADGVGTAVTMRRGAIRATVPGTSLDSGVGVGVQSGAAATLDGVAIDGSGGAGVLAQGAGTTVVAHDLRVTRTRTRADGLLGEGVLVQGGASLAGDGLMLADNREAGLGVSSGSTVSLDDVVIVSTKPSLGAVTGAGIAVNGGSTATIRRARLEANSVVGAYVEGIGSRLYLEDVDIGGTLPTEVAAYGAGVAALGGARLEARRVSVEDSVGVALGVDGAGTEAVLQGFVIDGVTAEPDGLGEGMALTRGAHVVGRGITMEHVAPIGILVDGGGTAAELVDLDMRGVTVSPLYAVAVGVGCQRDATLTLSHARFAAIGGPALRATEGGAIACSTCQISNTSFAGVVVDGGDLVLRDSSVVGAASDPSFGGGVGAFVTDHNGSSRLSLTDTTVSDHALAGVWVDGVNTVDIEGGELDGGPGVALRAGLKVHGNGIFARSLGTGRVAVSRTALMGSRDAAVLLDAATASFMDVSWRGNGVDVVQQACGTLDPPTGIDGQSAEICPTNDRPALTLSFDIFILESAVISE